MQDARRRTFLKTLGISALTAGLTPLMPSLKRVNAEEVDWFQGINRVKDPPMNLTPKEKGHAPFVQVPDGIKSGEPFNLAIQIGETLHPMTANHFIQWIEVYLGTDMVAR
ncbi:MAG: desulfoferrodoxin family protein, partial [Planctomycetota bacterium]